jgi:hypothetical protein
MLQWAAIFGGGRSDEEGGSNPLAAIALAILAPIAAMLIQMAISRSREFLADATGATISGQPLALASALSKIEGYSRQIPMRGANPATENMFIISPFSAGTAANCSAPTRPRPNASAACARWPGDRKLCLRRPGGNLLKKVSPPDSLSKTSTGFADGMDRSGGGAGIGRNGRQVDLFFTS